MYKECFLSAENSWEKCTEVSDKILTLWKIEQYYVLINM